MHTEVFIDETRDVVYTCFRVLQKILRANKEEVWVKRQETQLQCRCCMHEVPAFMCRITFSIVGGTGTWSHVPAHAWQVSAISYTDSLLSPFWDGAQVLPRWVLNAHCAGSFAWTYGSFQPQTPEVAGIQAGTTRPCSIFLILIFDYVYIWRGYTCRGQGKTFGSQFSPFIM